MTITVAIICPVCHQPTSSSLEECSCCHASLDLISRSKPISPVRGKLSLPRSGWPERDDHSRNNSLTILLDGYPDGVRVPSSRPILIGRHLDSSHGVNGGALVDLKSYDAESKGVDRTHALVFEADQRMVLYDMNSRNGTWVNGLWVAPGQFTLLTTQNRIRLGRLSLQVIVAGLVY